MTYQSIHRARFLARPNRFIAKVELNGREETVHVKNTGRCRELLLPHATVYLEAASNPARKTPYDLVAVEKQREGAPPLLVNIDSQIPNGVAAEWLPHSHLFSPAAVIRREVTWGGSRFDLYVEDGDRRAFVEVKGVTLEKEGLAYFPDAPTVRGTKHLNELTAAVAAGFEAYLLFVVQMKGVTAVLPNDSTDPAFGAALRAAAAGGVSLLAVDCTVLPDRITADRPLPVILPK